MQKQYAQYYEHLNELMGTLGKAAPEAMSGFEALHRGAIADGALTKKVKELMGLSIAVCVRCDGCIAYHVHDALEAGASRDEIAEAIGVAVLMGGGPSVVYGSEALEALEQFGSQT